MGFVRVRVDGLQRTRYCALYVDVKGRQRSAGTYATAALAEKAWRRAEDRISEGRLGDASRGRQKLARYVEEQWLPHHQMEARTRENYVYYLNRHILPTFGSMRLIEILPGDVREWVTDLQQPPGVSPECDPLLLRGAVRDLHHSVERPAHPVAPLQGGEAAAGTQGAPRTSSPPNSSTPYTPPWPTTAPGC